MKKICLVVVVAFFVLGVFAKPGIARDFAEIFTDCGIGAMISPKNDAVAAITNITWDFGTTAVSSNVSSPDTCVGGKERLAAFIYQSYDSLEKNLASGHGEYLDTLVDLAGYKTHDKEQFVAMLRKDFTEIVSASMYTNRTRYQKAEALYNLVSKHAA